MGRDLGLVALFGSMGAMARYFSYVLARKWFPIYFPFATMTVNIVGCLVMGGVMAYVERQLPHARSLQIAIAVGFLGSFTTFSAFGWETYDLVRNGNLTWAAANVAGNLIFGLAAVWAGRNGVEGWIA